MPQDAFGLQVLTAEESLELLAAHPARVGRVAFVHEERQFILPVNYAVHEGAIVFRTGPGSKLAVAAGTLPVAFESDDVEERWHQGWSVVVNGEARIVTDEAEQQELLALDLQPWAGGDKSFLVRVEPDEVNGRRLG